MAGYTEEDLDEQLFLLLYLELNIALTRLCKFSYPSEKTQL